MSLARLLVTAVRIEGRSKSEVARDYRVSRQWVHQLVRRFDAEGEGVWNLAHAAHARARGAPPWRFEDEIVKLRKHLSDEGLDAGAHTIAFHLHRRFSRCPSVATIWRVLSRRGFVTLQPQKRPKSSFVRFEAEMPNERWQADITHWVLAGGSDVEILNLIDDHSRFLVGSDARTITKAADVVVTFHKAAAAHGFSCRGSRTDTMSSARGNRTPGSMRQRPSGIGCMAHPGLGCPVHAVPRCLFRYLHELDPPVALTRQPCSTLDGAPGLVNAPGATTSASPTGRGGRPAPLVSPPSLALPKGGGAFRGIDEKFAANPVRGTATMAIPIAASPGRSGFGPNVALTYDSGYGNGVFGLGWALSVPAVTRKTDKGIPRYADADESDVFILSGAEDLVPELQRTDMGWAPKSQRRRVDGVDYAIDAYRPRAEGLFAWIERWTSLATGETSWRSISRDSVTSWFGTGAATRIADPAAPSERVFSWLLSQSWDSRGNWIVYDYAAEDSVGLDVWATHERNRTEMARSANRHLKRVRYGNRVSREVATDPNQADWMFELVLDYGEHDQEVPRPGDTGDWICRHDAFSSHRAGFEVRTYRLCQRALMFHHVGGDPAIGQDCLVRSTDFEYQGGEQGERAMSLLTSVTQVGYRRRGSTYDKAALPQAEFGYSEVAFSDEVRTLDAESLRGLPQGVDGALYRWADLDGEGLSGVVSPQAGAWFYKDNLGDGRFGPTGAVALRPATADLASRQGQLVDLAGDGRLDVAELDRPVAGFYERTLDGGWDRFVSFVSLPGLDWDDPNVRLVDLTGDGLADVLVTEDDAIVWHESLGEDGFAAGVRLENALDEQDGPRLVLGGGEDTIFLADMSGDGLTDLVRVRSGEICYWPNTGHGRFGRKVTMSGSPVLDGPDSFDRRRVVLVDVDGSGTTDLVYLGTDSARLYPNLAGNAWGPPRLVGGVPPPHQLGSIQAVDVLGTGTGCLVWSSPLPDAAGGPLRFLDLMGGTKPHLLNRSRNNTGAETRVHYAPSTRYYLDDERASRPWATRLPFPVHVVDRVETLDHISGNRFVSRYTYHHGYFDGVEREFRGFGRVDQFDTEEFGVLHEPGRRRATNERPASHGPPLLVRSWFHTGAVEGEGVSARLASEYWQGDPVRTGALLLDDTVLAATVRHRDGTREAWTLTPVEEREAGRALNGQLLRQEVYAVDGSEAAGRPYMVTEHNHTVELLQPRVAGNRHAVVLVQPRADVELGYDRAPSDPRVVQSVTLAVDAWGNVERTASIAYGRRVAGDDLALGEGDRARQGASLMTTSEHQYTGPVVGPDTWRAPHPSEGRTFEVVQLAPAGRLFTVAELMAGLDEAARPERQLPYEDAGGAGLTGTGPHRRLVDHVRTLYRRDDLTGLLPLGELESRALPGEAYRLAFTPGLFAAVYRRGGESLLPADLDGLAAEGGYVKDRAGNWWSPSGQSFCDRDRFFLPHRFVDPFGNATTVEYDRHHLLVTRVTDPVGNAVVAENDYRVLTARQFTDPNGNRKAVAFDCAGMVVATAVMGKAGEDLGDSLEAFRADPRLTDVDASGLDRFLDQPTGDAATLLGAATTRVVYDLHRFQRTGEPVYTAALVREQHTSAPASEGGRVQVAFAYSDGFGREVQAKVQAEPDAVGIPRWVGTGHTVYDNKGRPVEQFEPYFSLTHRFEARHDIGNTGVSVVHFYDPIGREAATLRPDHTYAKVLSHPWRQATWDGNDTALLDPRTDDDVRPVTAGFFATAPADWQTWHAQRITGALGDDAKDAAVKTEAHAGTPASAFLDPLGRVFLTVKDNGIDGTVATRFDLDIEGNQRAVTDARGIVVAASDFDLTGTVVHTRSPDAGERWILTDFAGSVIRTWDSRGFARRTVYDAARRPVAELVARDGTERTEVRTVYGEATGDAANLRGRVHQLFDGAGVAVNEAYDFRGNVVRTTRRFLRDSSVEPDWAAAPELLSEAFTSTIAYDALDRATQIVAPHSNAPGTPVSVTRRRFNEANLVDGVDVWLDEGASPTTLLDRDGATQAVVTNVDYNARGQRVLVEYGNGVRTSYEYDPLTFRLVHLVTRRDADVLQDLTYTHDPVGNVTTVRDRANQQIVHHGQVVAAGAEYRYDAIYRLTAARGREHRAGQRQVGHNVDPWTVRSLPNDGTALRNYVETYRYDAVGNLLGVRHHEGPNLAAPGTVVWHRRYQYATDGNRLLAISRPADPPSPDAYVTTPTYSDRYAYDAHGNATGMAHLNALDWDHRDRLVRADLGGGGVAHYRYDAAGERVRKVVDKSQGLVEQRLYLGGAELFRQRTGETLSLERATLHVMDGHRRVAVIETRRQSTGRDPSPPRQVRFQLGDHLGSSVMELDADGSVISYEEYHPYGTTAYSALRDGDRSLKRFRHSGRERDDETGFSYGHARYYVPWLARWASCDPSGVSAGVNRYQYVSGNPVTFVDPNGREDVLPTDAEVKAWEAKHPDEAKRLQGAPYTPEHYRKVVGELRKADQKPMPADTDPGCRPIAPSKPAPHQWKPEQAAEPYKGHEPGSVTTKYDGWEVTMDEETHDLWTAPAAKKEAISTGAGIGGLRSGIASAKAQHRALNNQWRDMQRPGTVAAGPGGTGGAPPPPAPPPGGGGGPGGAPPNPGARAQELARQVGGNYVRDITVSVSPAIAPNGQQVFLVASTTNRLTQAMLGPNEVLVTRPRGDTSHAEVLTMRFAQNNGYRVTSIHPSRAFCPDCAFWTGHAGVRPEGAQVRGRGRTVPADGLSPRDLGNMTMDRNPRYPNRRDTIIRGEGE
jgi:RHS repeat-associated protein